MRSVPAIIPDAVGIYDLCDEYGIYMIAECNMESHGTRDTDAVRNGDFSGVVPCEPSGVDGLHAGPCQLDVSEATKTSAILTLI